MQYPKFRTRSPESRPFSTGMDIASSGLTMTDEPTPVSRTSLTRSRARVKELIGIEVVGRTLEVEAEAESDIVEINLDR